jgi:hypothetical protein
MRVLSGLITQRRIGVCHSWESNPQPVYQYQWRPTRRTSPDPARAPEHSRTPMQEPLPTGARTLTAPRFYITGRQRFRPGAIASFSLPRRPPLRQDATAGAATRSAISP